jgi:two-component system response regulator PhoP
MRVLIVEDEKPLRDSIVEQLQQHGFNVDAAADGEEGLYCGREYALDLAIVDLGLPKLNGMELIKKLRAEGKSYPVLILTARDKWQDKVEGLQARMQALLRRSGGWAQPVLRCGAVALDPRTQEVTVNGRRVDLTSFEYRILEYLIHRAGEVISKGELTERLYAQDFDRDSNTIEVFIGRLRRKLDPDDSIKPIETLRGRGSRFALQRESAA